jgi:nucleoside-diphosphate-sugar epimerase
MGRGVKLTILLTGATGFVGRRLLNLLELSEHDIRLLSRKQHPQYETIICDFDRDSIPLSALKSVDTIFHIAGFAHDLSDSSKIESLYRLINVDFTVQLAKLAVQSGVKGFVFE